MAIAAVDGPRVGHRLLALGGIESEKEFESRTFNETLVTRHCPTLKQQQQESRRHTNIVGVLK